MISAQKDVSFLKIEELLRLLDCPQEEVSLEVRSLIKDVFSSVKDKSLVAGLLDYALTNNSMQLMDLLIFVPSPHDKHLLDKLSDGLKKQDKFRYSSLILFAVSRNPPPIWIHKIPSHSLNKEIMHILVNCREIDASIVVCCTLIISFLLPAMPSLMAKHLDKLLDSFLALLRWAPSKAYDSIFKPYLQIAVYSLFHKLYSLYPCNLLTFMRCHTKEQSSKNWLSHTLRPMLERVRLHPLLFTETRETEYNEKRWLYLDTQEVINECSKLCLDSYEEICEENFSLKDVNIDNLERGPDGFLFSQSETRFWSPSSVASPSTSSLPVSPIYALNTRSNTIAESPPEAAIEATPETTPYTSPFIFQRQGSSSTKKPPFTSSSAANLLGQLSPKKENRLKFNEDEVDGNLLQKQDSIRLTKLQEIQCQRDQIQKETHSLLQYEPVNKELHEKEDAVLEEDSKISDKSAIKFENLRKRKSSVYNLNIPKPNENELFMEDEETNSGQATPYAESRLSDESEGDSRRNSSSSQIGSDEEGLGKVSQISMTDIVKNVKTMRLRFLSQFGPHPNLSLLVTESSKEELKFKPIGRSRSVTNLTDYIHPVTKKHLVSSPSKTMVETMESSTQTLEIPVFDPYEKLLEALMLTQKTVRENDKILSPDVPSPYELLDSYLQHETESNVPLNSDLAWNKICNQEDNIIRSHLKVMHAMITMERHKREIHVGKNRKLFVKAKKLHLMQSREHRQKKEISDLQEEVHQLQRELRERSQREAELESQLINTVSKVEFIELQSKEEVVRGQRNQLKETSASLQKEKIFLTKDLKQCQKELKEKERHLQLHVKHANDNMQLQNEIEMLQKKLILSQELQEEIVTQYESVIAKKSTITPAKLAEERALMDQKIKETKAKGCDNVLNLRAKEFRIKQLEHELLLKDRLLNEQISKIAAIEGSWAERCEALAKRNETLCNINIIQTRELYKARGHPHSVREGTMNGKDDIEENIFHSASSHPPIGIPVPSPISFLSQQQTEAFIPPPPE